MYADNIVIFSSSNASLQKTHSILLHFCITNVMGSIYQRKRFFTMHIWPAIKRYNFYISIKILLECVNSYKYSVLKFTSGGLFKTEMKNYRKKSLKVYLNYRYIYH